MQKIISNKHYSLYSDGNYFPRAKKSGYGGYIEDSEGSTLIEYSEQIKIAKYAFNFEILGIIRGLQLAHSMGIKNLTSYCDDKTTMQKLQEVLALNGQTDHLPHNAKPELYNEVIELSKNFNKINFQYIPREQNKHSDALSRRYSVLMEKNYIKQWERDIEKAEHIFLNQSQNNQRIFFSHPSMVKMKDKNNPFLIANHRNKLARKITRKEQLDNYQYLFLEVNNNSETESIVKCFHYIDNEKKEIFVRNFSLEDNFIKNITNLMVDCLPIIKKTSSQPLWIHSNSTYINAFFEQKEKLPKNSFEYFKNVFIALNDFNKIIYHNLPFKHEFSPELNKEEEKKESLNSTIETLEDLIEQLQNSNLEKNKNKYFGKIIKHQIKSYQELLKRELNDIEKYNIITKTTQTLEQKGVQKLPKIKI